jgi:hypothetical protein
MVKDKYNWEKIVEFVLSKTDFQTVSLNNRKSLKYQAIINFNRIIISSINDQNSINISRDRIISQEEFTRIAEKYEDWKNLKGGNRKDILGLSQNSSYIFGILTAYNR